jgi:hypothetical protein
MRTLTEADVTFTFECLEEDTDPGGYFASGDDALDKQAEKDILSQLDAGNPWAWCVVQVTASWQGYRVKSAIGACSYSSEEECRGDIESDLRWEALKDLNASIARAWAVLSAL